MNLRFWLSITVTWMLIALAMSAYLHLTYEVDSGFGETLVRQMSSWGVFIPLNGGLAAVFFSYFTRTLRPAERIIGHLFSASLFSGSYALIVGFARRDWIYGRRFMWALVVYVFIVAALRWLHDRRELMDRQAQTLRLERELNQAQIAAFEAQVQPHFLFNTLHAIGMTCGQDATKAQEMLMVLGTLLRDSLSTNRPALVSFVNEFRRVEAYTQLLTLRYGDSLRIQSELDPECRNARVPPFAIQCLVENAMKHGIEKKTDASQISIKVIGLGEWVEIVVSDDGPGFDHAVRNQGSGLINLRNRLAVSFGQAARLDLGTSDLGGAQAKIVLPMKSELEEQ